MFIRASSLALWMLMALCVIDLLGEMVWYIDLDPSNYVYMYMGICASFMAWSICMQRLVINWRVLWEWVFKEIDTL